MEEKIIYFGYFDPNNSVFKTTQKDRAYYILYKCMNCENCEAYKRNKCALKTMKGYCPYGTIQRFFGPTKRAKSSYTFIREAKEKYSEQEGVKSLSSLNEVLEVGDYIYIPLSFLDNYVNPIEKDLGIDRGFITKEKFTVEVIKKLYEYKPRALFGGIIESYKDKEIPQFISDLKNNMPTIFSQATKEIDGLKSYAEEISFIGRRAFIKTLAPGKIRVSIGNKELYDWDGEKIVATSRVLVPFGGGETVHIFPDDKTLVIIQDNNTVIPGTTRFE